MAGYKRKSSDPILELLLKNVAKFVNKDEVSCSPSSRTNHRQNRNEQYLKSEVSQQMKASKVKEETICSYSKELENNNFQEEINARPRRHEDETENSVKDNIMARTQDNLNLDNKNQNEIPTRRGKKLNKSRAGGINRAWSADDDKILLEAMGKYGDHALDIKIMEERLGRTRNSIKGRICHLRSCGGSSTSRFTRSPFSVLEDQFIIDVAVRQLPEICLSDIRLRNDGVEMHSKLNRPGRSCYQRWENYLQPWILQYYAGTLNLDIKLKLVNYLEETFPDIKSIDWPSVAVMQKFAGHTSISLKTLFFKIICKSLKNYDKTQEVSLHNVAEYVRNSNHITRKNIDETLKRKLLVVEYFEKMVSKQRKTDFMLYKNC